MRKIEDEEIRRGVFLAFEVALLEIKKNDISNEIKILTRKLKRISKEKQSKIDEEIKRILKERRTT